MIMIQGVDMPKQGHCKIVIIHNDGDVEDFYTRDKVGCAMQVPPHGDLIDQDDYRDEFMEMVYDLCNDDPDNCRANAIIDLFDSAPTIIPADPTTMYHAQESGDV